MKPKVIQARPAHGPAEWVVFFQGTAEWFPTWRDAYDWAFAIARVRNVVADVIGGLP